LKGSDKMCEYTKPAECKVRYWHSGGLIIQTKNQSDVRDAAAILGYRDSIGDEFAQELVRRWNSFPDLKQQRDALLAACRNLLIFSGCDSTCSDRKEAEKQAKATIDKVKD